MTRIAASTARLYRARAPLPPLPLPQLSSRSISSTPSRLQQKLDPSHLTPAEAASKKVEQASTKASPPLSRALGVREVPTTAPSSEWKQQFIDREKRLKERKHLVQQVAKGYFHDFNEMRHEGGKAWTAPHTLIRSDLSLYFPDIEGISLATKEKTHTTDLFPEKISIVAMSSVRSSEEHINSFIRPVMSDLEDDPDFQYVYVSCRPCSSTRKGSANATSTLPQINLQENPLKSLIVSLFVSSLRRTIPKSQHPTYLLSHQSLEYLREPLGMQNKLVGYVFLVDADAKIRWAGCSWATSDEEESLRKCAHVLVDRLRKTKKGLKGVDGEVANSEASPQ